MESSVFDRLARAIGTATSRRGALRGLATGLLGAIGLSAGESEARRRRRRGRGRRCGTEYDGCNDSANCCEGLLCRQILNPRDDAEFTGVCAYRVGCGRSGDHCDSNRDCCRKFHCRAHRCRRR